MSASREGSNSCTLLGSDSQLGIVLLVVGSNGRTSAVTSRLCFLRPVGAVSGNGLCRDTTLQQSYKLTAGL